MFSKAGGIFGIAKVTFEVSLGYGLVKSQATEVTNYNFDAEYLGGKHRDGP
jgi:hypothetical protein